jgi:hypothetical protein
MRWTWALLFASLLGGINWWLYERSVTRPAGVLVAAEPQQQDYDPAPEFAERGYRFVRRAHYDIAARVLRREIYRVDGGATLAPVDLAVGWGPLSDSPDPRSARVLADGALLLLEAARRLDVSPGSRNPDRARRADASDPATKDIDRRIRRLRPGQIAIIGGYLVDVRGPGGFQWNTSLTRTDTGRRRVRDRVGGNARDALTLRFLRRALAARPSARGRPPRAWWLS